MTDLPIATYRLQLREGVDFRAAEAFLPILAEYGISHLYLSPVFAAVEGSTHGYDIADPTQIDPALGGRAGFERLARAAAAHGIGIVLDIVPNHTAFSTQNPWLRDVLRHGAHSTFAGHFDIDFSQPLMLPFLGKPFDACIAAGEVSFDREEDGPVMVVPGHAIPLSPRAPLPPLSGRGAPAPVVRAMHEAQPWRLVPWTLERDSVTHRRFFSVTGLIGMRVEEARVFDDMHRLVIELVRAGHVAGLRVDHVDGLADPAGYLGRLRDAVGGAPIWVEKILVTGEALPDWPIAGTTGYEAAQKIAQLLTDADGHAALLARWQAETGADPSFHATVEAAKSEVVRNDLAAELHSLIDLATAALEAEGEAHGPETMREAVFALLRAFPRYRSYLTEAGAAPGDLDLWREVRDRAAETVRLPAPIETLCRLIVAPPGAPARALQTRLQQVTGAVLAKAHEDTAGFRHTAYLAANEVGADPDCPAATVPEVAAFLAERGPLALTLTSSHDTKRSEDARMRLVAMSHRPDAFVDLWEGACALEAAEGTDPALRWYLVQCALAIWHARAPDLADRLADHIVKAAREGKAVSNWVNPDEGAEAALTALARAVVEAWRAAPPEGLAELCALGERFSLIQLALKGVMPGVPDFYGEGIGAHFALTDPDNRRPVDRAALARAHEDDGLNGQKARLTREILGLRASDSAFFATARTVLTEDGGRITLARETERRTLRLQFRRDGGDVDGAAPLVLSEQGLQPA